LTEKPSQSAAEALKGRGFQPRPFKAPVADFEVFPQPLGSRALSNLRRQEFLGKVLSRRSKNQWKSGYGGGKSGLNAARI